MSVLDLGMDDNAEPNNKMKESEPQVGHIIWKKDSDEHQAKQETEGNNSGSEITDTDNNPESSEISENTTDDKSKDQTVPSKNPSDTRKRPWNMRASDQGLYQCKSATPVYTIPGHTGYLTFASLYNKNV